MNLAEGQPRNIVNQERAPKLNSAASVDEVMHCLNKIRETGEAETRYPNFLEGLVSKFKKDKIPSIKVLTRKEVLIISLLEACDGPDTEGKEEIKKIAKAGGDINIFNENVKDIKGIYKEKSIVDSTARTLELTLKVTEQMASMAKMKPRSIEKTSAKIKYYKSISNLAENTAKKCKQSIADQLVKGYRLSTKKSSPITHK